MASLIQSESHSEHKHTIVNSNLVCLAMGTIINCQSMVLFSLRNCSIAIFKVEIWKDKFLVVADKSAQSYI